MSMFILKVHGVSACFILLCFIFSSVAGHDYQEDDGHNDWNPMWILSVIQFCNFLTSTQHIRQACKLANRVLSPHGADDDDLGVTLPSGEIVRQWCIKLDALDMLNQQRIYRLRKRRGDRIARYYMPDSSDQGKFKYYAIREERIIRPRGQLIPTIPFNPFGGFYYEKRILPLTTVTAPPPPTPTPGHTNPNRLVA